MKNKSERWTCKSAKQNIVFFWKWKHACSGLENKVKHEHENLQNKKMIVCFWACNHIFFGLKQKVNHKNVNLQKK